MSNKTIDEQAEARIIATRARNAHAAVAPFAREYQEELLSKLCQASSDKTLTDGTMRSMVGEISGVRKLLMRLENTTAQNEVVANRG